MKKPNFKANMDTEAARELRAQKRKTAFPL
jgi:hypothetical protein